MARNGAGTYTLPAGNPVTTGTTISSSWANNTLNDIASSLTASIAYDGQTAPVANLPMATYAHTNVGNATVRNMYASAAQVQDSTLQYLTSVSGTNTIAATAPISMSALAAGQIFRFIAAATNTGGVTLNINSIGARAITKNGTTPLSANDILINSAVQVLYDGTQFQLLNIAAAIPPGVITMWSGTIATIPTGWLLCNGSNGTPDLRNRFVIGAFQDTAGVAYTTITGADTQTGGSKDAIVVSHTHTATVTDPGHSHTVGISPIPDSGSGSPNRMTDSGSTTTSTATTGISVAISTTGSSGTNANLVPYFALAYIMKA
jgi:microcystin-dependent protein